MVQKSDKKVEAESKKPKTKKVEVQKKSETKKAETSAKGGSNSGRKKEVKAKAQSPKPQPVGGQAEVEKVEKEEKKTPQAKKPQTMEELLAQTNYKIFIPNKGDKVTGIITAKNKKSLVVDLGAKTEGIVADKEFEAAVDFVEDLKVGDELEAFVLSSENDKGQILLSLKKAAVDAKWDKFISAYENEESIDVKGIEVNKGGLIVLVDGVRGFVPSSQFGKQYIGNFGQLKGKTFGVKVIEVDQEKNRLIFSERHVSEAAQLAQRESALESVEADKIYTGVVSGVMPFGLFVTVEIPVEGKDGDTGFVEGLVHISEISWEKVDHPKDYHKVGDELQIKVLGVDEQTGKLNLSIKQLSDDPWKGIEDKYPISTVFEGEISRIEPFGVFVNVEQGVDGLIHMSKLDPSQTYEVGSKVSVSVESVDPGQRRMSLSPVLKEVPLGYK